ncbi:hypothetical protein CCH79_00001125 [Gambusia affinis]|uniref:MOB kinase activator 1B n=1 Tax=Gambusia affinis TaxID=33528 RepID=A0A315VU40_GAMAF|nr:hypothetical protein CCH79_00001125 [Gambusia affinis]
MGPFRQTGPFFEPDEKSFRSNSPALIIAASLRLMSTTGKRCERRRKAFSRRGFALADIVVSRRAVSAVMPEKFLFNGAVRDAERSLIKHREMYCSVPLFSHLWLLCHLFKQTFFLWNSSDLSLRLSPSFHSGNRSSKTFKPKKNIPEGSHQYELLKHAEATLGSGNLRMAVMLPEGEDLNEWVAVNTVDFFNQINMLYGTITDFCTEESCPVMSAGPKYEYHWADGTNIKKPIKCSAPKYIDYLMTWVQDQLDDETLFPSKIGVPFKRNFMSVAKTILKRLFRVYAHIYHQHFDSVMQLQEEAHLNTSFKHFIFFVQSRD